jgi:hypothetical protein
MADWVLRLLPDARMGHLGVYRDEKSLEPVSYYQKLPPDIAATEVLLIDPMLATGGSGSAAVSVLKAAGVTSMKFVCLVAAPEGIQTLHGQHPEVPIYCAAIRPAAQRARVHPAGPGRRGGPDLWDVSGGRHQGNEGSRDQVRGGRGRGIKGRTTVPSFLPLFPRSLVPSIPSSPARPFSPAGLSVNIPPSTNRAFTTMKPTAIASDVCV